MDESNQPNLDDWSDYAGDWIKAEYVKEFPVKLVCVGIDGMSENGRNRLVATVEYNNRTWKFDLNKTNQNFIKSDGLMPKDVIGKIFECQTIQVRNPTTGGMVGSLVISKIIQ